jgi:hypothetical protein
MNHVTDIVIKSVDFIRDSALNHSEFVAVLENVENEHGEIIYHTTLRWLNWGFVLKQFSDLLNEIKLFTEKMGRNIKQVNDERWITDLPILQDMTVNLNNLILELKGKISSLLICLTISRSSKSSFDY